MELPTNAGGIPLLTTDQKLNIAENKLATDSISAYDAIRECLDRDHAERILHTITRYLEDHVHVPKWRALIARAYYLLGRTTDAAELAFSIATDALLARRELDEDAVWTITEIAAKNSPLLLPLLRGGEGHVSPTPHPEDVLIPFYLKGILAGVTPPGISVLHEKADIDAHGIREKTGTSPVASNRYIRFLKYFSSFTPVMKNRDAHRLGGGYFFKLGEYNLVVDPGHHFLDNFFDANLRVADISGILITHFHDDHYADFPSLMSLLFRYWDTHKDYQVDLFTDQTTAQMFSPLLGNSPYIKRREVLSQSQATDVLIREGVYLSTLPTFHKIFREGNTGVGFSLSLGPKGDVDSIVVTGDTGWQDELAALYSQVRTNSKTLVLIAHVSSACAGEIPNPLLARSSIKPYDKHLCIYGTCKAIEACRPNAVILSEIGEELAAGLKDICELITKVYDVPCFVGQLGERGDYLPIGLSDYSEWGKHAINARE